MTLSVGLLHFTAPPVTGGVETVLGHHARLLADAGHHVRVIVGRGGSVDPRADLVRIPTADTRNAAISVMQRAIDRGRVPPGFDALVAALAGDLRRATDDLDVVIAHNVCSINLNVALTAAVQRLADAGTGPTFVAWNHDVAAVSARLGPRLHPGYPWDLFRRPWPGVVPVVVSEARRVELAAATGTPLDAIRVVPNGIDRAAFLGLGPATRRLIDALGLAEAGPILLAPARVTPRKNLELAIAVVAEMRRAGDDARLIITGATDPHDPDGATYLAALRRLIAAEGVADGVHLLVDGPAGWRSARVVAELFRVADALFYPSRDEGFGLPVLEAAVCRLPVVCADVPSLREVGGPDAAYLGGDGDPARIAAVVGARLSGDPAYRLNARVRATYGWSAVYATHIEPLLRDAVAERIRPRASDAT